MVNNNLILSLQSLNKFDLRLLRNTILARKGYIFRDKKLVNYFNQVEWYRPQQNIISLSDQEEKIISTIKSIEIGENIEFQDFCNLFKPVNLPFKFDEKRLESFQCDYEIHKKYVRKFINEDFLYTFNYCAVGELFTGKNYKVFFYIFNYPVQRTHYIATYTLDGKVVSNKLIYTDGGDIQLYESGSIFVDKDHIIHIKIKEESGPNTKIRREQYIVDSNGKIKKKN